jgi:hypothetical protein
LRILLVARRLCPARAQLAATEPNPRSGHT